MSKISIIVPIFNAEKYLHCCVDSILAQTFTNFELLLINDGSEDASGSICDRYAIADPRIHVFHKRNEGVSSARNLGLDFAQGKYIIFLDADDYWVDENALKHLVEIADLNDLDLVRGEYKAVNQDGGDFFERPLTKSKAYYSYKVLTSGLFYVKIMCGENYLGLALLKKTKVDSLRFNVGRAFLEDMEFYIYFLLQHMRCMYVPIRFYAYRIHQTSASRSLKIKNLIDSFEMCDIFNDCSIKAQDAELKDAYRRNSVMMYYWTLCTLSESFYPYKTQIIKDLKLRERQAKTVQFTNGNIFKYPIVVFLNPDWGSTILSIYLKIKKTAYSFRNIISQR